MKRILSVLLCVIMLCSISANFFSVGAVENETEETIFFDDGSYIVITISQETAEISSRSSVIETVGSKTYKAYASDNELLWSAKVTGQFRYNESIAMCISSSVSHTIYDSDWRNTSQVASKSSNKAIGDFTFKRYTLGIATNTKTTTITLSCSPTGVLS